MKIRQTISLFFSLLLLTGISSLSSAEVVVIVNPQNTVSDLSAKELADMYKLDKTTWDSGGKIEVVNLKEADAIRKTFSEAILKKSSSDVERLYLKRALSGKGQPPKVLGSSSEVKDFVKSNNNSIGYIDIKDADGSVKVLSVDGKKQID